MKAWVLHGINDLRFEQVPTPEPKRGEVSVRVKAVGVCGSDVPRVFSAGAYHYPIIPGHEFSGITPEGRRVGVFPLIPCFECESCGRGIYETCSNYGYIGSRRDGAFAECVAVPEWNLMELPDGVSFEQGAMLEPVSVALHAARMIENAKSAAVVGNGAIGILTARWIDMLGGNAAVIGRNDNSSKMYDACVEAVGSIESLQRSVDAVKPNGRLVLVGNPNADFSINQKLYWQILRKQLTVKGSWNSGYPNDWRFALEHISELNLDELISHRFRFDELDKALTVMTAEKHLKVLVNL
ncbi:MAG: galactitol-1-phosphate 5-dehydrogenase [Clostridiales Family XIII bacterium]|jgi:L-iditol 2-dehydrogenase|nr:galactitol-1-phosphate 5-dehydrogenase [Clostridiales Family XIII bacterium]